MGGGQLGMGAAVALAMLPALAVRHRRADLYLRCARRRVMIGGRRSADANPAALPAAGLLSVVAMLFPFYWMPITSIKPNRELYSPKIMPLIVHQPTLKHYVDLLSRDELPDVDVQHPAGGRGLDRGVAGAGDDDGLPTGAHELSRRGRRGHRRGRDATWCRNAASVHPDGRHHQPAEPRQHAHGSRCSRIPRC